MTSTPVGSFTPDIERFATPAGLQGVSPAEFVRALTKDPSALKAV
jgi:hypothetical protein